MRSLIMIAGLFVASAATASTPAAWNQMNTRVSRACVAKSGLPRPVLLAKKISFSDEIGTEVLMVRGTDKSGRMKRLLCAFNRSTGRAEVEDADAWNGPATKP